MKNAIGLTGWSDGPRQLCCWLCQACKLGAPYAFDATLGADWRGTAVTAHEWWMKVFLGSAHASPVWCLPGFTLAYCVPDFMHVMCLGTVRCVLGNCVWVLFKLLGGSAKRSLGACGVLCNMVQLASKALGMEPPFRTLTLCMFRPKGQCQPHMSLKAAEGRHFLPILAYVQRHFSRLVGIMSFDVSALKPCATSMRNSRCGRWVRVHIA